MLHAYGSVESWTLGGISSYQCCRHVPQRITCPEARGSVPGPATEWPEQRRSSRSFRERNTPNVPNRLGIRLSAQLNLVMSTPRSSFSTFGEPQIYAATTHHDENNKLYPKATKAQNRSFTVA